MGLISCDTLGADTVLSEQDQQVLVDVASAAATTYERLVKEAADRAKEEEEFSSAVLNEATACPEVRVRMARGAGVVCASARKPSRFLRMTSTRSGVSNPLGALACSAQ